MSFKKKDKVYCVYSGFGEVVNIYPNSNYPIEVLFDKPRDFIRYTKDGKSHHTDKIPHLHHRED